MAPVLGMIAGQLPYSIQEKVQVTVRDKVLIDFNYLGPALKKVGTFLLLGVYIGVMFGYITTIETQTHRLQNETKLI